MNVEMEEQNVKETRVKDTLTPEQGVILIGCKNQQMIKSVMTSAKKQGVDVVMLNDNVITDYLRVKGIDVPDVQTATMETFLGDVSNRTVAEQQAKKLWTILTGNNSDISLSETLIFTQTEVVRATTMSHKKACELFDLLCAFGYLEWVDCKKRRFRFHFNREEMQSCVSSGIEEVAKMMYNDIIRFKTFLAANEKLTTQQRKDKMDNLKHTILSILRF